MGCYIFNHRNKQYLASIRPNLTDSEGFVSPYGSFTIYEIKPTDPSVVIQTYNQLRKTPHELVMLTQQEAQPIIVRIKVQYAQANLDFLRTKHTMQDEIAENPTLYAGDIDGWLRRIKADKDKAFEQHIEILKAWKAVKNRQSFWGENDTYLHEIPEVPSEDELDLEI